MAMCAPNPDACGGTGKCEGSTAELAFEYVTGSKGMYQEYQYSYTSYYGESLFCFLLFPPGNKQEINSHVLSRAIVRAG